MAVKKNASNKKTVTAKKRSAAKRKPIKRTVKKTAVRKLLSKKPSSFLNNHGQLTVEEKKYYTGPVNFRVHEESVELPQGYGDNKIVLMVRDPYWLYTYWELNQNRVNEISSELGNKFHNSSMILRVYDTSDWTFFDIGVSGTINNWYLNVGRPNTSFCVDIGYLTPDGYFVCAARSNIVTTPRDSMSDSIDEEWMIPDWEQMYALSGGFGRGKGSFEIKEIIERNQWKSPSSWVSSGSQAKKQTERPFWLAVNCELIVYGATEPSASLTIQGNPIKLKEDGTFSLRFSLPDGKQVIPVEATRDDGLEKRKITPIVEKRTK